MNAKISRLTTQEEGVPALEEMVLISKSKLQRILGPILQKESTGDLHAITTLLQSILVTLGDDDQPISRDPLVDFILKRAEEIARTHPAELTDMDAIEFPATSYNLPEHFGPVPI